MAKRPDSSLRALIVNAPDFGVDAARNRGILEAHRAGVLTSATVLATGRAFEEACRLGRDAGLPAGVHLNLTEGRPLLGPFPGAFAGREETRRAAALGRLDLEAVEAEWDAQVARVRDAGLSPTHLDSHHHVALFGGLPGVLERVARRHRIPAASCPVEVPTPPGAAAVSALAAVARPLWRAAGLRMADHHRGLALLGRLDVGALIPVLRDLPAGVTELTVHPGYADPGSVPFSNPARETELRALASEEIRRTLAEEGVRLASFSDGLAS